MGKAKAAESPKGTGTRKKWGGTGEAKEERLEREISIEDELKTTILNEVPKMKMITHSAISLKYNIRISLVKEILNELVDANKIKPYMMTNRLKIYVPA